MSAWKPTAQHFLAACIAILAWKAAIAALGLGAFVLPQPESVIAEYCSLLSSGKLLQHTIPTLAETLAGCGIGAAFGMALGYALSKSRALERMATPYVIALNAMPIVCIAPLVTLWFGFGIASKVVLCALISFFPVFVNTFSAIKSIDSGLLRLFAVMRATKTQLLYELEVPAALPGVFAGLKIAVVTAVVGAVVGEFVGSKEGLGHLIMYYSSFLQTSLVFAVILQLVIMSSALYYIADCAERRSQSWKR